MKQSRKVVLTAAAPVFAVASSLVVINPTPAAADHGEYCGHGTSFGYYHFNGQYSVFLRSVFVSSRDTVGPHIHKYMVQQQVIGAGGQQYWANGDTYERAC